MFNDVQTEIGELIGKIKEVWGNDVSQLCLTESTDTPFNMFTIAMKFYSQHDVIMEYERSTLGISVKTRDGYIVLSRLAKEPIYRGLKSYIPENLLHNFKVLDKTLKDMTEQD